MTQISNFSARVLKYMQVNNVSEDEAKKQIQEENKNNSSNSSQEVTYGENNKESLEQLDYLSAMNSFLVTNKPVEDGDNTIYSFTNSKAQTITINDKKVKVTVNGASKNKTLKLTVDKEGKINIENNGATSIKFDTPEDLNINVAKSTKNLSITSGSGNDLITVQEGVKVGTINAGKGDDIIVNAGTASMINSGAGDDIVLNSGNASTIFTANGDDTVFNSGTANNITAGSGDDVVVNQGSIKSTLDAGSGNDKITNKGTVSKLKGNSGDDVVLNSGTVDKTDAGKGDNVVININNPNFNIEELKDENGNVTGYKSSSKSGKIVFTYNEKGEMISSSVKSGSTTTEQFYENGVVCGTKTTMELDKGTYIYENGSLTTIKIGDNVIDVPEGADFKENDDGTIVITDENQISTLYAANGSLYNGIYDNKMYQNGILANDTIDGKLYKDGVLYTGDIITGSTTSTYKDGILVSTNQEITLSGTLLYAKRINYDENGNQISDETADYNGNGKIIWLKKSTYENGNKISSETTHYDEDENITELTKTNYEYDEKCNKISDETTYYDEDENITELTKTNYEYDENGNRISEETTHYDSNNNLTLKEYNEYDEKGNTISIERTYYDEDENITELTKSNYEYDENHVTISEESSYYNEEGDVISSMSWNKNEDGTSVLNLYDGENSTEMSLSANMYATSVDNTKVAIYDTSGAFKKVCNYDGTLADAILIAETEDVGDGTFKTTWNPLDFSNLLEQDMVLWGSDGLPVSNTVFQEPYLVYNQFGEIQTERPLPQKTTDPDSSEEVDATYMFKENPYYIEDDIQTLLTDGKVKCIEEDFARFLMEHMQSDGSYFMVEDTTGNEVEKTFDEMKAIWEQKQHYTLREFS